MNEEVKAIANLLFDKYGSVTITPEKVSEMTTRSVISLTRDRAKGTGIPYLKLGAGGGSDRVMYNVFDVARFIVGRKQKSIDV